VTQKDERLESMKKDSLLRDKNLYVIFSVSMMGLLSVASIAPAFPKIMSALDLTASQIGLLVIYFTLPSAILAPFLGVMADRLGRKRILVPCLFLFGIAGFICGFINNFTIILVMRVLQGIGASTFATISLTLIADMYSGPRLTEVMGMNSTVISISVAVYPLIGGALATLDWHYPFLLTMLAVFVGIAVLTILDNPEPETSYGIGDYLGGTWKCLKDIRLVGYYAMGTITFIIVYGAFITYYPLLMADRFGASPFLIGLITSGGSLAMAISSSQVGRFNRRFDTGTLIKMAFILCMAGAVIVPFIPSLSLLVVPAVMVNFAVGIVLPCLQSSVSQKAPPEYRAAVMSINSTVIRIGQTLGPMVMTLAYVGFGYTAVYFSASFLALLVVVSSAVSGRIMRRGEIRTGSAG
jgi:ACDE family multidrug resistance protein